MSYDIGVVFLKFWLGSIKHALDFEGWNELNLLSNSTQESWNLR
jgi:hypothetical protein